MHDAIKRVILYLLLTAVCLGIAIYWTESRTAFIGVFAIGLVLGVTAELMFWWHVLRLPFKGRRR